MNIYPQRAYNPVRRYGLLDSKKQNIVEMQIAAGIQRKKRCNLIGGSGKPSLNRWYLDLGLEKIKYCLINTKHCGIIRIVTIMCFHNTGNWWKEAKWTFSCKATQLIIAKWNMSQVF